MPANGQPPDYSAGTPGAPQLRWERVFPGDERQISVLRQWLASLLPACTARDDVLLVATELGTNAVRHTASGQGGSFEVEVTWHGPAVRVAVTDAGAPQGPRAIDDPMAESGRGLMVVQSLAVRTGQRGDHRRRRIWADVDWDTAAGPPLARDPREAALDDGLALLTAVTPVGATSARRRRQTATVTGE
jgi:anti-sigma regulatory factor (Ser/Thr protein kinase)